MYLRLIFFCQFVVTITISIGRRVLNFNFLRNKFTNVLSESLQLLKLVLLSVISTPTAASVGQSSSTLVATNGSTLIAGLFAYLAEMHAVVSVLGKHFCTYSCFGIGNFFPCNYKDFVFFGVLWKLRRGLLKLTKL